MHTKFNFGETDIYPHGAAPVAVEHLL